MTRDSGYANINGATFYYETLGGSDVADIAEIADRLIDSIPAAREIVLSGAHMVNMEQPDAFNQCILEFLKTLKISE